MSKRTERQMRYLADGLTSIIEDAVYKKLMNRTEASKWYKHFAIHCGLHSVINHKILSRALTYLQTEQLKDLIRQRLEDGDWSPVSYPDRQRRTSQHRDKLKRKWAVHVINTRRSV